MAGAKILPHQQRRASQSRLEIEAPLRILEITLMDAESFLEGYKKLETFSQHIPVRIERVEGFKRNVCIHIHLQHSYALSHGRAKRLLSRARYTST